jgi:endonuclease/exonuclease/phosphatase (EEP) superfamily protein YafD
MRNHLIKGLLAGLLFLNGTNALAKDAPGACESVLDHVTLPSSLRLLVWNVHKFKDPRIGADLAAMAKDADLVLLQENQVSDTGVTGTMVPHLRWTYTMAHKTSGVATGSSKMPVSTQISYTRFTEPVARTPKSILYSQFQIEGSDEQLLVINTHGINFVRLYKFEDQIQEISSRVRQHRGPLILAGDFNTWSPGRRRVLMNAMRAEGLSHVHSARSRYGELDHIFIRGFNLIETRDASLVNSSDHPPLMVRLRLR